MKIGRSMHRSVAIILFLVFILYISSFIYSGKRTETHVPSLITELPVTISRNPELDTVAIQNEISDKRLTGITSDDIHDKWIVITTTSKLSTDVIKWATIDGWHLLVVGDLKTPNNWTHPGVEYLSLEKHRALQYETINRISSNSYTRKNIGYLYAIHHGARFIYDTDDDNHPINGRINFQLRTSTTGLLFRDTMYVVMNPYAHFGQPTIWPRGFPMEYINTPIATDINNTYTVCTIRTPTIQHALFNKDPDVDAIFRLTRKRLHQEFNITFDSRAPPLILPEGVFAPFNSQNTLFTYEALWALPLPTSVISHVTDIWRAYWAQRLMWLIGQKLAFIAPNAIQLLNAHDYRDDFKDENDVYIKSGELITFLKQWQCSQNVSFFKCANQLSRDMAFAGFWTNDDAELIRAWIVDLRSIGYPEPNMNINITGQECYDPQTVYFSPIMQTISNAIADRPLNMTRLEKLVEFCGYRLNDINGVIKKQKTQDNILLIIVFNIMFPQVLPMLDNLYYEHFPNIAYCGETKNYSAEMIKVQVARNKYGWPYRPITFINITNEEGYLGYECVIRAMEMNFDVDGYLIVGDDVLFSFWNQEFDVNIAAYQTRTYVHQDRFTTTRANNTWGVWASDEGSIAVNAALDELQLEYETTGNTLIGEYFDNIIEKELDGRVGIDYSDIYYIPRAKYELFLKISKVFLKHWTYLEIAIPTIIHGLHPWDLINMFGVSLENEDRLNWKLKYNTTDSYLHPVKLSKVMNDKKERESYCNIYVKDLLENVYDVHGWIV